MSVRMRHTSSHTKNRRSHHALKGESLVTDKESGALRLPHRLDETTGMYRGKQIVSKDALSRRTSRMEKRVARASSEERNPNLENIPANAEIVNEKQDKKEGMLGRFTKGRAKARSGFGGGA